jgi:nucleotide-binding universal stress UspA family protein
MTVTTDAREPRTDQSATLCSRVLVGIDGSPESIEAARQGARLLVEGGDLTLLSAYDIAPTLVGGLGGGYPTYLDDEAQRGRAVKAVRAAHARHAAQC